MSTKHAIFSDSRIVYLGEDEAEARKHYESKVGNVWADVDAMDDLSDIMEVLRNGKCPKGASVYKPTKVEDLLREAGKQFAKAMADMGVTQDNAEKALDTMADTAEQLVEDLEDAGKKGLKVIGAGFHIVGEFLNKLGDE